MERREREGEEGRREGEEERRSLLLQLEQEEEATRQLQVRGKEEGGGRREGRRREGRRR